ncbi:MAG: hypothetical protein GQ531_04990 [Sulfurovum sp.]|nr:hypothetical protein [Sulfurovum sp.]
MNLLWSLLYAPLVFLALKYFDIQVVSLVLFTLSLLWFFLLKNKKDISALFPVFYMVVAVIAFFSQTFLALKIMPLVISTFFSLFILLSYLKGHSIILYFANKFSKHDIDEKERKYIHDSTLFWFGISLVNSLIHLSIFLGASLYFWIYYSSFGWYFLFIFAGLLQFLHRRYVFLRRKDV